MQQKKTSSGSTAFNLANLPAGLYYLYIYGVNEKPEVRRVVVNH